MIFYDVRQVTLYSNWKYVLIEAGPEQAGIWRDDDYWKGVLPDLMFPADHSWLVSTWIAATAMRHNAAVLTQDQDFATLGAIEVSTSELLAARLSRIYRHVRFAPMDLRTVLEVIPRYDPVYSEVPAEVIAEVDVRLSSSPSALLPAPEGATLAKISADSDG